VVDVSVLEELTPAHVDKYRDSIERSVLVVDP
jgi:hypothetical protein